MKQDKLTEITKRAIEAPQEYTQRVLEKTEKVRTPSPRVDRIGRSIGSCIGAVLMISGCVCLFAGKMPWALGTAAAGGITLLSNRVCRK